LESRGTQYAGVLLKASSFYEWDGTHDIKLELVE